MIRYPNFVIRICETSEKTRERPRNFSFYYTCTINNFFIAWRFPLDGDISRILNDLQQAVLSVAVECYAAVVGPAATTAWLSPGTSGWRMWCRYRLTGFTIHSTVNKYVVLVNVAEILWNCLDILAPAQYVHVFFMGVCHEILDLQLFMIRTHLSPWLTGWDIQIKKTPRCSSHCRVKKTKYLQKLRGVHRTAESDFCAEVPGSIPGSPPMIFVHCRIIL